MYAQHVSFDVTSHKQATKPQTETNDTFVANTCVSLVASHKDPQTMENNDTFIAEICVICLPGTSYNKKSLHV